MHDMTRRNFFDVAAARGRCLQYRKRILDISQQVQALHIGSAYSCTEIVDAIYHGLMRRNPDGTSPDTFLMSKGHGCMILYVILEDMGVLSREDLDLYCKPNGRLGCHPDYGNPGIEASTGALGHGLSMAVGMALAERGRKTGGTIYTVLSDGEVQEGSTWEAVLMASSLGLVQPRRLRRQQRLSEPRPHVGDASVVLSAGRKIRGVRLGMRRGRWPRFRGRVRCGRADAGAAARSCWSARPRRARASATWRTCRSGTIARRAHRNT